MSGCVLILKGDEAVNSRNLAIGLMSLTAVFASMPPCLSAAPVITNPTGTALASGTLLKATNVGELKYTSSTLEVKCTTVTTTGTVTSNSTAGGFEGDAQSLTIGGTSATGDCTAAGSFFTGSVKPTPQIAGGLPWCFKSAAVGDNLEIRGGNCNESARSIKFAMDLGSFATCTYERSSLTGTFVTDASGQDATGSINAGQTLTLVSGFGCPSSPTLDMAFTEETDPTSGSTAPVYISS
jgi:hypothetical protein